MSKIERVECGRCGHVFYRTTWTPCPKCFRPGRVFYTGESVKIISEEGGTNEGDNN